MSAADNLTAAGRAAQPGVSWLDDSTPFCPVCFEPIRSTMHAHLKDVERVSRPIRRKWFKAPIDHVTVDAGLTLEHPCVTKISGVFALCRTKRGRPICTCGAYRITWETR